jgi:hypothetical protein
MLIASQSSDTVQTEDTMSTQVIMNELPNCDICARQGKTRKARYDAATRWGPWAYMCNTCWFMDAASRELGTGIGQELILKTEPEPDESHLDATVAIFNALRGE